MTMNLIGGCSNRTGSKSNLESRNLINAKQLVNRKVALWTR